MRRAALGEVIDIDSIWRAWLERTYLEALPPMNDTH
jgi:hypothetical protein